MNKTPKKTSGEHLVDNDSDKEHKDKKKHKESLFANFVNENRRFWLCFNFWAIVISIGLAVGTYLVVTSATEDCSTLKNTLWLVFIMHIVNVVETLFNVTGLEKKLCTGQLLCGFFVFEVTVLVYMQVSYFEAMAQNCLKYQPLMYFWLMAQVLVFYGIVVFLLCFFFRKFCQDPDTKEEED